MTYDAIVLAAGRGSRSGLAYNKVLFPFEGRPILWKSLELFALDDECAKVVVACAKDEIEDFSRQFAMNKVEFVCGGKDRQDSVRNALTKCASPYVLIHDGARPFCSEKLRDDIKAALKKHPAVIPGLDVVDTIKEVDENGLVVRTPKRSMLKAVQTPQAFQTEMIVQALDMVRKENLQVTDDAQAVELCLHVPSLVVAGEPQNFKVTSPQDIERLSA